MSRACLKIQTRWGWRDGSAVKSTDCSSRGPEFKSQQPYGGSQPPIMGSDALFWCVSEDSCSVLILKNKQPGVVAHAFNPSTWEAEEGGFLSSRPAWSTKWVPGQPGLYRETLSWKQTNKQTKKKPKLRSDEKSNFKIVFFSYFTSHVGRQSQSKFEKKSFSLHWVFSYSFCLK